MSMASRPFTFFYGSHGQNLTVWAAVWPVTIMSPMVAAAEEGDWAMWTAVTIGVVAFCIITCVKLSQAHELRVMKQKQDHELARISMKQADE